MEAEFWKILFWAEYAGVFGLGYLASIWTWPFIHAVYVGTETEIENLRARIAALKGK